MTPAPTPDPIRAARREAAKAAQKAIAAEPCIDQGGVCQMPPYPCTCALAIASAAVAAFLRAMHITAIQWNGESLYIGDLAARPLIEAVERAARGGE